MSCARKPIRAASSAAPALAGGLVSALFLAGAIGYAAASSRAETTASPAPVAAAPVIETAPDLAAPAMIAEAAPAEPPRPPLQTPVIDDPAPLPEGPVIALVIDDVGLDAAAARRVIDLPAPATLAFLPYAEATPALATEALGAGHEVFLHMPMEPQGLADPGPYALMRHLTAEEMQARLRWAWSRVPGATGLNNHMGSRFTQDLGAMRQALSAIVAEEPLFLDSLTTADSRGAAAARGLGLRTLTRDVFLDHVDTPDAVRAALAEAEGQAREQGLAIAIGHPRETTFAALEDWIPQAQARGVRFVRISRAAALQTPQTRLASAN